jgi:hypothetical protein
VDAVVLDPRRGRAKALVVRSAHLHRRRLIPVDAVVAVDPFRRRIEIERAHPHLIARAAPSAKQLVAAVVTGISVLAAWSVPRVRELTVLAHGGARGVAYRANAAWTWLVPRARTAGSAGLAMGFGLTLRCGGAIATRATSAAAWLGPRLSATTNSARTNTASAVARLGPRLSRLARTASTRAIAVGSLCVLGVIATASWIGPRLRVSAEAVAWAALTLGGAAAGAVQVIGTRLSHRVREVSSPRRN